MYSAKKGGGAPQGILSTRTCVRNVQTFMNLFRIMNTKGINRCVYICKQRR